MKWWQIGLILFAVYTFLGFFLFPQLYYVNLPKGELFNTGAFRQAFNRGFMHSYAWACLTPLVFWINRRLILTSFFDFKKITLLLLSTFSFAVVQQIVYFLLGFLIFGNVIITIENLGLYWRTFNSNVILCAALIALHQAFYYFQRFRDREFRLQEAQLHLLKSQLHPHFLFNSLNAIAALVYISPPTAHQTISQLSDLLRISLNGGNAQEVTLEEELSFLEKYVRIHQTLMKDRLEFVWNVEAEAYSAAVPKMLLQPLVENSIQHGLAPLEDGGRIELEVKRGNGGMLNLIVRDNGKGLPADKIVLDGNGIGLVNTKARLRHLYGEHSQFKIDRPRRGGVEVSLTIPFRDLTNEGNDNDEN